MVTQSMLRKMVFLSPDQYTTFKKNGELDQNVMYLTPGGEFDIGNANVVVMSRTPAQHEVDMFPSGTIIMVYDPSGKSGKFGKSAYDIAVATTGFQGTESEWIASLQGRSAFQTARDNGFDGTEDSFNNTLAGVGNINVILERILG